MTEEQKNHKDMIIDFDELWLDELIEEDLKKEKKKSELSDEMKKKLDQQDLNKFWDALEKSTFQQKISSTNNKEWSFISDLITNTSNLQKEQKENSTLDQQNKINKQIEQHNSHTNTEQHFQDVKQTNNTTVNNNNTTIIQEQQQSKTNEQPQQNTTIQQNITNIENNQNNQNTQNNQNNNTQNIEDKKEDKQVWNEPKEETIKETVKEVIIQNTEKTQETNNTVTNTNTNNNTNTNEIWTAIEEKREKIEWWSEINVKPTWAYSKEVEDNSALFTQEKELQQLQENKQIQNKIDKEWNEIKKEENTENNVTVKIETPTTQQQTQTTSPSQQQTSEIWNDKIQQELEEKKKQEQNKEDTHSIQDVMNNEKKQNLPKQQEKKQENREEKVSNTEQKNDEDLWKSKVQNNIWKWRKIAVNTLDDLSNIEETIEKEKNRLWKRWEYTNKDLENIKRTMWEWSQFTKLIDWIDKKIVWWPLSNELRDKYIEESTQWQLFWNLEEVKREYEKRQTKERWNFVMKKISWIEDTNINEYQMYETIAKFTWFLNFSLSQTLVRIFTWWYAFLVIIYTTLWVLSIKWWFTIPWMWAWLWWLLFWWVLIFVLSKFSLDVKKS